jgi:hypothetical protein
MDEMLDSCESKVGENELRGVYLANMKKSKLFIADIAHCERHESEPGGETVFCSAWLKKCIIKHLGRRQKQKNREEQQTVAARSNNLFGGGGGVNAMPATEDGKPTRRRRGRSAAPKPLEAQPQGGTTTALPAVAADLTGKKVATAEQLTAMGLAPPYKGVCFYFNNGNVCTKGDKCNHKHLLLPESERIKMETPQRRAPSADGKGKGKGRGASPSPHTTKSGSPAKSGAGTLEWPYVHRCFAFEREGTCIRGGECKWPHKTVQQIRSEMGSLRKQGLTTNLPAGGVQAKP